MRDILWNTYSLILGPKSKWILITGRQNNIGQIKLEMPYWEDMKYNSSAQIQSSTNPIVKKEKQMETEDGAKGQGIKF